VATCLSISALLLRTISQRIHDIWVILSFQDEQGLLKYATVVDAGPQGDALSQDDAIVRKLQVRTSAQRTSTMLSCNVYCFKPTSRGGDAARTDARDTGLPAVSVAGVEIGARGSSGRVAGEPESVSASDIAGAVRDMLSRLNVPVRYLSCMCCIRVPLNSVK
jgi:hypothetical protein